MSDELMRFEVTLTKPGERTQTTFTWAPTREGAQRRMREQMAQCPDLWDGWTAHVAERHTAVVSATN